MTAQLGMVIIDSDPMNALDSFGLVASSSERPNETTEALDRDGFAVVPGPAAAPELQRLADSYDRIVKEADPSDVPQTAATLTPRATAPPVEGRPLKCA